MSMETELKVKEEVQRLVKAGFIRPAIYADWLSNIVLVLKRKIGAIRICMDYRNLNEASPKDEYPMPMADMLVDGAAHNQMLSFMDGNVGYNQIIVAEEDIHKTTFMCPGQVGHSLEVYMDDGSRLVQDNKEGKEHAVYYLSRTLTEVERKYYAIKRLCLALYFTAIKLKHYMLPFTTYIIAKTDLIKYMLTRPMLRGRIDHPGEETENMDSMDIANADLLTRAHTYLNNPIYSVHLTPGKLYFDGSKTDSTSRVGIVLENPLGIKHCYSFQLDF
ncbi:unnamed protein product [Prunus armeniaca]